SSMDEAELAFQQGVIELHAKIKVRLPKSRRLKSDDNSGVYGAIIETTAGRIHFNMMLPPGMDFYNYPMRSGDLASVISDCYQRLGRRATINLLDDMMQLGFRESTRSGLSFATDDLVTPETKAKFIAEAEKTVMKHKKAFDRGMITGGERYNQVLDVWTHARESITVDMMKAMENDIRPGGWYVNPVFLMAHSGARGGIEQIRQLAGMRGLMAKPTGEIIETPIKANFREGLSVLEYFSSTHGARKGLADTALKTADSGYLTRKLVDVAHEIVIREEDCGSSEYLEIPFYDEQGRLRPQGQVEMSIYGRTLALDFDLADFSLPAGSILSKEDVNAIYARVKAQDPAADDIIRNIELRSPLTCQTPVGVCRNCYGMDMSTMRKVGLGEAVGVVAAESIGEPGTQLTMRTFHTGGIATGGDITQGLPRVIELVEARKPKVRAIISELDGVVSVEEDDERIRITVTSDDGEFSKTYRVDKNIRVLVRDGVEVEAGQQLTRGAINPHDLLESRGPDAVRHYLVEEIQRVYRAQGVSVHDKHIETIVRQMLKYVEILESGDSNLLEGQTVERFDVERVNNQLLEEGKEPASWKPLLLGITKASLSTKSWLSAASFQHTTHVLTEAAVSGKADDLLGLKENVILGRLIPAGTGLNVIRETYVADDNMLERQRKAASSAPSISVGAESRPEA
ncbi:MAG: DNA-directed RNA polymerase subunit beta', partial [Trueperaceae bacterium]|nr:DNA-directed RNA polymerase subunit beta' [Trueperaceae bacterium]